MRTWTWGLALLLGVGIPAGRAGADEAAEIVQLKQAIAELQKRVHDLEERQRKATEESQRKAPAAQANHSLKFSGYLQGEFRRQAGEGVNVSESDVRRARLKLEAALAPFAALTLQTDVAREVELKDAYFDLNFDKIKARVGQFKLPMSFQILESSSHRLAPERALINTRSVPGERDRGFLFDLPLARPGKTAPVLQLGVFNGRGISQQEADTDKDILAAIHLPSHPWSGRLAYLTGKYQNFDKGGNPTAQVTKRRWMADVQYDEAPWNAQLQYGFGAGDFPRAGGTVSASDVRGGYIQVARQLPSRRFTLLVRYQRYDPDTDAAGNTVQGPLLGLVYDPSEQIRYLLSVERLNDQAKPGSQTLVTLRTQVRY